MSYAELVVVFSREFSRFFCGLLLALHKRRLVYPGVFVGAGHALRPTMFFEKFNPFRVVVYRECVSCMEIRPLQGHFLFTVNRFYNVFPCPISAVYNEPQAAPRRSERIISRLAFWHPEGSGHALAHLKTVPLEPVF